MRNVFAIIKGQSFDNVWIFIEILKPNVKQIEDHFARLIRLTVKRKQAYEGLIICKQGWMLNFLDSQVP